MENIKIDTALIGEVLGEEVIKIIGIKNNSLGYEVKPSQFHGFRSKNLDTLTRLMKEWCLKQDGMMTIYYHQDTIAVSVSLDRGLTKYSSPSMSVYTEFEAVYKATEYVYKQVKG